MQLAHVLNIPQVLELNKGDLANDSEVQKAKRPDSQTYLTRQMHYITPSCTNLPACCAPFSKHTTTDSAVEQVATAGTAC